MRQPAQVLQRVWHALKKVGLALIEPPVAIGSQGLHDADVNERVIVLHEGFAVNRDETGEAVEIVVEQFLAQLRRQIGLAIEQERRDVVLQRAFAAALVVQKKRLTVAQHDIARLEIPIEKIIVAGGEQKLRQAGEIMLQRLFIEGHAGEPQKIILEIVQIPGDGLAIEAGARIAYFVIQIAASLDLKTRQHSRHFAIRFNRLRSDGLAGTICAEEFEECRIAQVFFKVGALAQILRINLRHRQSAAAKMPGEFKESDILLAHGIEDADGADSFAGEPDDGTPRAAELALKRLHVFGRQLVMLLEEPF